MTGITETQTIDKDMIRLKLRDEEEVCACRARPRGSFLLDTLRRTRSAHLKKMR